VVHLDEINPHVHCTVLPVTEQNKISWKKVMAGKDKYEYRDRMLKLHDEFAEVNKKYGLERGDAVAVTGAKHRSTEEYRDWLDNQARKLEIKIDTQKQTLYEINAEIAKAEKRVKALYTMLSNLEAQKKDIEDRISTLESQLESQARQGQLTNDELTRRRQVLNGELDAIAAKINERRSQLVKARQQLQDVADRKSQLEQKTQVVEKQLRQNQNEYSNKVMRDMENTAWGRDKDDDDETWRRKCFHMGMKMMRPSPGKLSRRNTPRQQAKGLGR
jgi:chromosome segregation ATPase